MPEPDDVTEAFARALFESHVQLASEEIAKLSYDFDRIDRTFAAAHEETDRSCAITIFALIDELICDLFLLHVNPAFGQSRRRLFDEFGILPTASRRLQMLFALNWIDRDTFHDLNLLRKIRNEFAHRASVRSFEEDPIKGYMASFRTPYADVLDRALSAVGLTFEGMPADQIKQIVTKKTRVFLSAYVVHCLTLCGIPDTCHADSAPTSVEAYLDTSQGRGYSERFTSDDCAHSVEDH
jgi:DNA-binding MltR family transcriptional regulator